MAETRATCSNSKPGEKEELEDLTLSTVRVDGEACMGREVVSGTWKAPLKNLL